MLRKASFVFFLACKQQYKSQLPYMYRTHSVAEHLVDQFLQRCKLFGLNQFVGLQCTHVRLLHHFCLCHRPS